MGKMNVEIQVIGKRVVVARTRNNGRRIISNFVKIDKALLRVSHENWRGGSFSFQHGFL
jgi:hypothetical protein